MTDRDYIDCVVEEAHERGADAYYMDPPLDANPHAHHSPAWHAWYKGWQQARQDEMYARQDDQLHY